MAKQVFAEDLEAIAIGGALLGTGGGGDPYIGKLIAQTAIRKHGPVTVVQPDEVSDSALCVPVCMMGAPTVMLEKLPNGEEAIQALKQLEAVLGKKAEYLICIEAGGLNSTIPYAVAAITGLPLIDGDGMGRAFPELQMVSFTMGGISATPLVLADDKGNSSVISAINNHWAESLARAHTIEMGGAALVALYPMTGKQMKHSILRGTLRLIEQLGRIIREEQAHNRHPKHKLITMLNGIPLGTGRIIDIDRRTEGGFARGSAKIKGMDEDEGRFFTVEFQNEFLMFRNEKRIMMASTPDLICALDADAGHPVTTEQLRFGLAITFIGLPCDPKWRSAHGIELAGPRYFKYAEDYQPIEQLNGRNNP